MSIALKNVWGTTHTGYQRSRNEDRFLIKPLQENQAILLGVADGMGGEAGGDISAQIVVDNLQKYQTPSETIEQDLTDILDKAGKEIRLRVEKEIKLDGMGTTATVVLVSNGMAYWSHVGDSRLYLSRKREFRQITIDHTFVQDLIEDGTLSQYDADRHPLRNMLDQCVGYTDMIPDSGRFSVQPGDAVLLCSDGLTRQVSDDKIKATLDIGNARKASEKLVKAALKAGGIDNVTAVVLIYGSVS
ncbi:MAG: protein phosphatase 2C domain-containing protein [Desulfobacteraceae bacterium]|jgi:serine/threonine protein phosphatase PrpC|nr:protein phosphatase 2C domain-containing protein [Desulfobacteraceae bacterium]